MTTFHCRSCSAPLAEVLVDLGSSPLSNSYLEPQQMQQGELYYPLCVYLCHQCWLAQLPEFESAEGIFSEYTYFSSYSDSWLEHARTYVAAMTERFGLGAGSQVIEIASNDGYLLQYFKERAIPCLGIEPAGNVAKVAVEKGIPTRVEFFGSEAAQRLVADGIQADLLLGNNVLAHVPNLNDFVAGLKIALAPAGVLTLEFPHLLRLMDETSSTPSTTNTSRISPWSRSNGSFTVMACAFSTSRSWAPTAAPCASSSAMRATPAKRKARGCESCASANSSVAWRPQAFTTTSPNGCAKPNVSCSPS